MDHGVKHCMIRGSSLKRNLRGVLEAGGGGGEECWLGFILPCSGHRPGNPLLDHSGFTERTGDGATSTRYAISDYVEAI